MLLSRDDMGVDMGHALTGILTILDGNVQGRSIEDTLDGPRHTLDGRKQVLHLSLGEIVEARDGAAR